MMAHDYHKFRFDFETATVIWTAGVQGALVAGLDGNSLVEKNAYVSMNSIK
jgi:NADH dehydrogenase